jgi:thymidylate synthase (FAD)
MIDTKEMFQPMSVTVIGHYGNDRSIAEAAWVSTDRTQARTDDEVKRLLKYLAKNSHWTPFGQTAVQMRFFIPIYVARQIMRSNVGIVWNEESRRYVDRPVQFYDQQFRLRSPGVKQGSLKETMEVPEYRAACIQAAQLYESLLERGVAPECARTILPLSCMTTIVGTFSIAALARLHCLRSGTHAQGEAQLLAWHIGMAVRTIPDDPFATSWRVLTQEVTT